MDHVLKCLSWWQIGQILTRLSSSKYWYSSLCKPLDISTSSIFLIQQNISNDKSAFSCVLEMQSSSNFPKWWYLDTPSTFCSAQLLIISMYKLFDYKALSTAIIISSLTANHLPTSKNHYYKQKIPCPQNKYFCLLVNNELQHSETTWSSSTTSIRKSSLIIVISFPFLNAKSGKTTLKFHIFIFHRVLFSH